MKVSEIFTFFVFFTSASCAYSKPHLLDVDFTGAINTTGFVSNITPTIGNDPSADIGITYANLNEASAVGTVAGSLLPFPIGMIRTRYYGNYKINFFPSVSVLFGLASEKNNDSVGFRVSIEFLSALSLLLILSQTLFCKPRTMKCICHA